MSACFAAAVAVDNFPLVDLSGLPARLMKRRFSTVYLVRGLWWPSPAASPPVHLLIGDWSDVDHRGVGSVACYLRIWPYAARVGISIPYGPAHYQDEGMQGCLSGGMRFLTPAPGPDTVTALRITMTEVCGD